jgi:hypothetical protein
VLDAILVAGNDAATDAPIINILALVIQLAGFAIKPLDSAATDRAFFAKPDRRADDENVCCHNFSA